MHESRSAGWERAEGEKLSGEIGQGRPRRGASMQQWVLQEVWAILSEDPFVNNMFYRLADKLCRRESNCWQCQAPKVATGTRRSEEQLIKELIHKKY